MSACSNRTRPVAVFAGIEKEALPAPFIPAADDISLSENDMVARADHGMIP